jgi:LysM repeat protein
MNFGALVPLIPLIVGLAWLGYLIFRKDLASQSLIKILTYFLGVIIIFLAVGWLIDFFLLSWANERLQNAENNSEWVELVNTTDDILDRSFVDPGTEGNPSSVQVVPIVVTPTPSFGAPPVVITVVPNQAGPVSGRTYTVVAGDTLHKIAQTFGTTVDAIMIANNLTNPNLIYPGQVLVIP